MTLRWKFWRRADRKALAAPTTPVAASPTKGWMPLMSPRELLGLQRVVGNQAVLELLALKDKFGLKQQTTRDLQITLW